MVTPKSRVGRCLQSQRAGRLQSHLGTFGEVLRSLHSCWVVLPLPQYFYWQYLYQHIRGNKGGLTHCICLLAPSSTSPLSLSSSHLPGVSLSGCIVAWHFSTSEFLEVLCPPSSSFVLLVLVLLHLPLLLCISNQPSLHFGPDSAPNLTYLLLAPLKIWNQGLEWGSPPLTLFVFHEPPDSLFWK